MKRFDIESQRFYSVSEEEERLYSTGCDELDDLLEKVFCEGYEFAQREFNNSEAKRVNNDYFLAARGGALNHGLDDSQFMEDIARRGEIDNSFRLGKGIGKLEAQGRNKEAELVLKNHDWIDIGKARGRAVVKRGYRNRLEDRAAMKKFYGEHKNGFSNFLKDSIKRHLKK